MKITKPVKMILGCMLFFVYASGACSTLILIGIVNKNVMVITNSVMGYLASLVGIALGGFALIKIKKLDSNQVKEGEGQ